MAPASSWTSAAPASGLRTDPYLPPYRTLEPDPRVGRDPNLFPLSSSSSTEDSYTSLLDFPKPPDLFSSHACPNISGPCARFQPVRDLTPHARREPDKDYSTGGNSDGIYDPFRGYPSHSSPQLHTHRSKHPLSSLTPNTLPTVASEATLLTRSDTHTSPVPPRGSHLPYFPRSPYRHLDSRSLSSPTEDPGHDDTVLIQGPTPSLSLPPPSPPPCPPPAQGEASGWGCCCSLGEAPTPLSRYLGKVGHAALPLLNVGGLLDTKPSDVQT